MTVKQEYEKMQTELRSWNKKVTLMIQNMHTTLSITQRKQNKCF